MRQYPSQARLRELFDYDPDGFLVWRIDDSKTKSWNYRYSGKKIGTKFVNNQLNVRQDVTVLGKKYKYIDIMFIYFYGIIPENKYVKSKAGYFLESKPFDLFLVDSEKMKNCGNSRSKNKFDYKGVRSQSSGNFQAFIDGNGLGTYKTAEAAASAWDDAAEKKYGRGVIKNNSGCIDYLKYKINHSMGMQNIRRATNKFKGVFPNRKKWMARIGINGSPKYLGTFETQEQAARAYNISARAHYGEHAVLNDIPDPLGTGDIF